MKVYQFYLKETKNDRVVFTLYAFTAKKKYAHEFMNTRNMDVFKVEKVEMDEEEYQRYGHEHRDFLLTEHSFLTKDVIKNEGETIQIANQIPFVVTEMEYMLTDVENDCESMLVFSSDEYWNRGCVVPPVVYNNKLHKALKLLQYENMYKFYNEHADQFYEDDYSGPDIAIDEFSVLFDVMKNTIKPSNS